MVTREQIVAQARLWIGTPYHLKQMLRGVGCDCATFLLGVYSELGIFTEEHIEHYTHDWFQHTSEQRYLLAVARHARKVAETTCHRSVAATPGCLALVKCVQSERFNHGGIVVKWPRVIHACVDGVVEIDASRNPMWERNPIVIFDPIEEVD